MTTGPILEAHDLVKNFGDFAAVKGISFTIERGESFGFLGPNGAGKTSTMRMISAVSQPTSGTLSILGLDPREHGPNIRGRLGVVPQEDTLELELSVRLNLEMFGRYFDIPRRTIRERTNELLEFAQLTERANDKVDDLSGGMKRRLTIARALINQPELLLLDEPTASLDPDTADWIRQHLETYRKTHGATILLASHNMLEVERLCDRVIIMKRGRIEDDDSPDQIMARYNRTTLEEVFLDVARGRVQEITP